MAMVNNKEYTEEDLLSFFKYPSRYGVCDFIMTHEPGTRISNIKGGAANGIIKQDNVYEYSNWWLRGSSACHVYVSMNNYYSKATGIYTSVRGRGSKARTKAWVDFLVGPNSPWRSLDGFKDARVGYDDKKMPTYIFMPITDKTLSQYLMNFLIATRVSHEREKTKIPMFYELLNAGFTELEAMFISQHYPVADSIDPPKGDPNEWNIVQDRNWNSHCFLDTWNPGKAVDFKRLLNAEPNTQAHMVYRKTPHYTPCNTIWKTQNGNLHPILIGLDQGKKYTGAFPALFKKLTRKNEFETGAVPKFNELVSYFKEHKELLYK